MEITDDLIDRIAELAKLKFEGTEREQLKKDFSKMLDMISIIEKQDVAGLEPLVYVNEEVNVLRNDEIKNQISKEEALKNAPDSDSDYFKVPKVLK